MMMGSEGWKVAGQKKGPGIPSPSGRYRVGCVDLMHQLEGDEKGGLLMRLHYPTEATPDEGGGFWGYSYSSWYPHRRYVQGYMEFEEMVISEEAVAKVISK